MVIRCPRMPYYAGKAPPRARHHRIKFHAIVTWEQDKLDRINIASHVCPLSQQYLGYSCERRFPSSQGFKQRARFPPRGSLDCVA